MVRRVGWGDGFGFVGWLVREVVAVFQMDFFWKKHVIINGLEIKGGYSIVQVGLVWWEGWVVDGGFCEGIRCGIGGKNTGW